MRLLKRLLWLLLDFMFNVASLLIFAVVLFGGVAGLLWVNHRFSTGPIATFLVAFLLLIGGYFIVNAAWRALAKGLDPKRRKWLQ